MASFTDRAPVSFTPYVPQQATNAKIAVGMDREEKYIVGVQRVQDSINSVQALSNSLLRPQAKEYLNQKLDSLVTDINTAGGQDFSNANVYTSLMSKANAVGQDRDLNIELQNSLQVSNKIRQIQELKEKSPKDYSEYNERYAMEDVNKWLSSGSPVGSTFNDTKPFSAYYDYHDEMQKSIKQFLENQDVQETIDPRTGLVTRIKGKSPDQMREFLMGNLSEKAKQQMRIEGYVMGNNMSDQTILELYNSGVDNRITQEKQRNDKLQQLYHSPTSKLSQNEKLGIQNDINTSNKMISSLESSKSNSNIISNILANKGDYYGEYFMENTIDAAARSNAPSSITYDTNQAIVKQLDNAFNFKLEQFRQSQQNARASMENKLGWARLQQDAYFKNAELGFKEQQILDKQQGSPSNGGAIGTSNIGLGQSPNETVVLTARSPILTKNEVNTQGYDRFSTETNNMYQTYGRDKYNLIKQLLSDPVTRRELAGASGMTDNQLSSYIAAPNEASSDIYTKFLTMNPKVLGTINNYLEAKNQQWERNEKVDKTLDNFFYSTQELKNNIASRESYNNNQKEKLKANLADIGVGNVRTSDGKVITVDDILDYIAKGTNYNVNSTIKERVTERFVVSGTNGDHVREHKVSDIDPYVKNAIIKIKESKALEEYKNAFNESFGQEGMISSFNFDLSDKKDKTSRREFNNYASQIVTLWNDPNRPNPLTVDQIDPNFVIDRATGEVTFSYSHKDSKGKTIVSPGNKIIVPSYKSSLIDSDKQFAQLLFYGQGVTPLIKIRGSKPLNISLVSTSDDSKSQFTVNSDGSPAKYFLRDQSGNIIKDPMGGFNSPTEAINWIEDINQRGIDNSVTEWYNRLATHPQYGETFNKMSDTDQAKLIDQYIENMDITNVIQTLSNNRSLNMARDLRANLLQQSQNNR